MENLEAGEAMNLLLQYGAKVVEGSWKRVVVAPGEYWTPVNARNPTLGTVKFRFKGAAAHHRKGGPVPGFHSLRFRADAALEVDRDAVLELVEEKFVKDLVVIESPIEFDEYSRPSHHLAEEDHGHT